ncbi:MAG TPA: hypothetical protein VNE63_21490 [Candidatus Acidoferrales bacterium]|nr:hypothetical protein [Candidatus Acidoferrales bacterium]
MKKLGIVLGTLLAVSVAGAQQTSTIQMQCRPLSSGGNTFIESDETVINGMTCHVPAAKPAPAVAVAPTPAATSVISPSPEVPKHEAVLIDGTSVPLKITETISSADANDGDRISFEVVDDVDLDGHIVIPRGSVAMGTVVNAHHKRRMGRAGKLDIALQYASTADGEKIPLRGSKEAKGGNHAGAITGGIVATSIVFFPAAPLFLMMKGHDITINQGTAVNAFVDGDTRVEVPSRAEAVQN